MFPDSSPFTQNFWRDLAPERGLLCFDSAFDGFLVHIGDHQDFAVFPILHDRRYKTIVVKLQFFDKVHCVSL